MPDLLTSTQLTELRKRWVFDLYTAGSEQVSVYNKRYTKQFFADADLQALARRARKRWGEAIGDGVPQDYTEVIHQSGGEGFAAQPAGGLVNLVSSDAADVGVQVTLYGTTQGSDTLVKETVTLNGLTPVATVKVNWGRILAAVNSLGSYDIVTSDAPAGTITITTAAAAVITTLGPTVLQRGWQIAGRLVAGLPITAMVGSVIPEVGLEVYDDDLTIQVNAASSAVVGFVGIGPDGAEMLDSQALSGTSEIAPNLQFTRLDAVLTGDVPETLTVTVLSRDVGPYEAEEVLFAAIQVLAFEAYLGSDEYTAALEDKADQVRKGWESRIASDMKKLQPGSLRGGFAEIRR